LLKFYSLVELQIVQYSINPIKTWSSQFTIMSFLLNFQLLKENAPPCLTVAHFAEFADDKGKVVRIVLQDKETMHYILSLTI